MANIQESLDKVMEIDGAVGAALVDFESGMCLGTVGGGALDMELAGAGNTEVVRAKKSVIDRLGLEEKVQDILVTMEEQVHMIRMFHKNDNIFTYLALDKSASNLALARMELEDVDRNLELS
jgi:predicted regulator of Ras-like GTPase activity (Roadblock/LC7/MglB family)